MDAAKRKQALEEEAKSLRCPLRPPSGVAGCPSHFRALGLPQPSQVQLLQGAEAPELRRYRRPGRPGAPVRLLFWRPTQNTCSEITGTPPNPP